MNITNTLSVSLGLVLSATLLACSPSSNVVASLQPDEISGPPSQAPARSNRGLYTKAWQHGAADCKAEQGAAFEVYQHDARSYIFRQNKCHSYEAPFLYLLLGQDKVLLLDTGAATDTDKSGREIVSLVSAILDKQVNKLELLVIHSHSHSDHYGGDAAFINRPNTTVVGTKIAAVTQHFNFAQAASDQLALDLGGRKLTIINTPGHQEEAITVYDPDTDWLLTGDTLYPGLIYVKDWPAYKTSVARLHKFAQHQAVSAILGGHIEMKRRAGKYYEIGSRYQPKEAPLPISTRQLAGLHKWLQQDKKQERVFKGLVIKPMSALQKSLSNTARWLAN